MYQLMVSGGVPEFSTMTLTSGANKWASRAVIVLQLAAWSAVGIVLLQKGVTSLQKASSLKNSSEAMGSDNFGYRRSKEKDNPPVIPLHEEFPAKVDQINSQDAWLKHRNELVERSESKPLKDLDVSWMEGADPKIAINEDLRSLEVGKKMESQERRDREENRENVEDSSRIVQESSRIVQDSSRTVQDSTRTVQDDVEETDLGHARFPENDESSLDSQDAKKGRKKARQENAPKRGEKSSGDWSDRAFLTEEIPARISKTIANERSVEDRTIPLRVLDKTGRVLRPEEMAAKSPSTIVERIGDDSRKSVEEITGVAGGLSSSEKTSSESIDRPKSRDVAPTETTSSSSSRNATSVSSSIDSRGQDAAWDSRKRVRLSHLSGGGAAAAVAMVAVGAVMLILGPAVIVLRALDERRQERRFLKLSGQDDLPPTYEQATLMDEAPRYSTLSLNTILGPPPPPSPSPTLTRAHLV